MASAAKIEEIRMKPAVRLFGVDRVEIGSEDSWLLHAPPEKGEDQWKDGYSAKEHAKAWLRPGRPEVPDEWWAAIASLAGEVDEIHGRREHQTALERFARKRQHDLFACLRRGGDMTAAVGVEAKACEDFDGLVGIERTWRRPATNVRDATCSPGRCSDAPCSTRTPARFSMRGWPVTDTSCGPRGWERSSRRRRAISPTRSSSCTSSVRGTSGRLLEPATDAAGPRV
jgi:hypothetical protein